MAPTLKTSVDVPLKPFKLTGYVLQQNNNFANGFVLAVREPRFFTPGWLRIHPVKTGEKSKIHFITAKRSLL